jgi:hypothetical protein
LSVFGVKDQLWASETRVTYQGGDDFSQVVVSDGPPREARGAKLTSAPRQVVKRSFLVRTFFDLGNSDGSAQPDVEQL